MRWRHYETREHGLVSALRHRGGAVAATYSIGTTSTGKNRVFAGHFVSVTLHDGDAFTGEDAHSLRRALRKVARQLSVMDTELTCAGLDPRWRESGLSVDTGWGYFDFYGAAVHMMDAVPPILSPNDPALNRMIREAIASMQIGLRDGA